MYMNYEEKMVLILLIKRMALIRKGRKTTFADRLEM